MTATVLSNAALEEKKSAVRGLHDLHVCMGCERAMTFLWGVEILGLPLNDVL